MPARLNRRRYREIVTLLKEVIADKKAPQQRRLRAAETLMTVYDRHDRTQAAKEARGRAVVPSQADGKPEASLQAPGEQRESVEAFLSRIAGDKTEVTENNG